MRPGDRKVVRILLATIVLLIGVVGIFVALSRMQSPQGEVPVNLDDELSVRAVSSRDHVLGSATAPIKLIVYTDLECPYCKSFHQKTQPALMSAYDDIAIVFRHFPLPSRPKALPEAEAAECAYLQGGEQAFWGFINAVFAITPSNNNLDLSQLPDIARRLGLDVAQFEQCQAEGGGRNRVREDMIDGALIGINATPSILVKSATRSVLVAGDRPASLRSAIEYVRAAAAQ